METKTIIELEIPVASLYSLTSQKEGTGREELAKVFFMVIKGAFDCTTFQKLCVLPKFRQHHPLPLSVLTELGLSGSIFC